MRHLLPLLLIVGACAGGEDTDVEVVCDATITSWFPEEGAGPVATGTAIRLDIQGTAVDPTVVVTGPNGDVPGTVTVEAAAVVFTANGDLPEDAELSWSATVCEATAAGTFTTGSLSGPIDPASAEGNTFAVDLANATWISPPDAEDTIRQFFAGAFLIGVQSATETELDVITASGQETASGSWQQDPCYATIDFEPVDFRYNPYFALETEELRFTVDGFGEVLMHDVVITGGLTDDELVDGTFEAEIDTRDYNFGGDACNTLEMYAGIECVECRTDGAIKCVWMEAVDVEGELVPSLTLVPNENPDECNDGQD